jgi:predicted hydrolase (HD superfamily)
MTIGTKPMISRSDALTLLKSYLTDDGKLSHSIRVAELMESLARQFHLPSETWYMTGLLHDIDIQLINNDWPRHGIEAQKYLTGHLPPAAMKAILTHDRNTGLKPETKIGKALVFADVVDNLSRKVTLDALRKAMQTMDFAGLKAKLPKDIANLQVIADYTQQWPGIRIQ